MSVKNDIIVTMNEPKEISASISEQSIDVQMEPFEGRQKNDIDVEIGENDLTVEIKQQSLDVFFD